MICLACAELEKGGARFCRRCGQALVAPSLANIRRYGDERIRKQLEAWAKSGALLEGTADRLEETLPKEPSAPEAKPPPKPTAPDRPKQPRSAPVAPPPPRPPEPELALPAAGVAVAAMVEATRSPTGAVGGVEAFAALDAHPVRHGSRSFAVLSEYVWWFVGALLVLGGSVMGVREAWLALGGAWRQLLVAGALFTYHAGFVGMAAVVARRSAAAGRVLSAVALGLLPVVFVALASLLGDAPGLGVVASLALVGAAAFTLAVTAGRFEGLSAAALWTTFLPPLAAELVVGAFPSSSGLRLLVPLVGVGLVWWTSVSHYRSERLAPPGGTLLALATFGAVSLLAVDVVGAVGSADGASVLSQLSLGSVPISALLLGSVLLMALLAETAAQPASRGAWPRAALVLELSFFAATAALALAVALPIFSGAVVPERATGLTAVLTVAAAAVLVGRLEGLRPPVLHLALALGALGTSLVAAIARPGEPAWWAFGAAMMAPVAMSLASTAAGARRGLLLAWSVLLGAGAFVTAFLLDSALVAGRSVPAPTATALLVGVFAHLIAGRKVHPLHWYGGVSLLAAVASYAWLMPESALPMPGLALAALGFAALALLYRAAGALFDVIGTRDASDSRLRPFDDLGLLAALGGLSLWGFAAVVFPFAWEAAPGAWVGGLAAASLLWGAQRDQTRVVGLAAAYALDVTALSVFRADSNVRAAMVHAAGAVVAVGLAHLLRPAASERAGDPRFFFGAVRMPSRATGRGLFADAFAWGAMLLAALGAFGLVGWLNNRVETDRSLGLEAGLVLVVASLSAFFSKGFERPRARGATATLFVGGAFVALTAVVNRIGRPLPPEVVGRNLTLIALGLWLFAWLLKAQGPRLARALGNEPAGVSYRHVPLVGVLALATVLAVDGLVMGAPFTSGGWLRTPPLFFLGSALALTLLARGWRFTPLFDAALALALPGVALATVQRALLGPSLVPLPGVVGVWVRAGAESVCASLGQWSNECLLPAGVAEPSLWNDAALGVGLAVLLYSSLAVATARGGLRLLVQKESLEPLVVADAVGALKRWAFGGSLAVVLVAFALSDVPAAALVLGGGALLLFAKDRHLAARQLAVGAVLLVHAVATSTPQLPLWPGPVLALLALVPSLPFLSDATSASATPRRFQVLATLGLAQVYALAAFSPVAPVWVGGSVLGAAVDRLGDGTFLFHEAVPVTLGLSAIALMLATLHARDGGARVLGALAGPVAALAGTFELVSSAAGTSSWWGASSGEHVAARAALAMAAAAAFAHLSARWMESLGRKEAVQGLRFGRDALFAGLSLWVVLFSQLASALPGERLFETSLLAVALAVGVAVHAAWVEHTARHVYFVEGAVLGLYAVARSQVLVRVTPELDALLVLALGFFLVGVTVLARRFGTPQVADATRRFTGLLPLLMPFVLGGRTSQTAVLAALGSSALYGTLAAVEHSRLFGSLAAGAANVALLVWALVLGLDGVEVYLAPLGILLMALGHVYGDALEAGAKGALRTVGGLLLYAPAGVKVALQLAQGSDGLYSVAFGAVCLLGIAAGVALQIRAYLAFGTLFLVLEVLTTLVYASVRDHRIAFLVLSVAGLSILGSMILVTLKREAFTTTLETVRVRLRGWE